MMYSWCLVLAFYPCIAVADEGSFSLGVYILLSAGFIAGDEVAAVAPPPPLDVSQWPKSEEQRRPSSRGKATC